MNWKIELSSRAAKFIRKQDPAQQVRLLTAISKLPDTGDIKPLKGQPGILRLRVGTYRVLYTLEDDRLIVFVIEVGNRGDIYK